VQQWDLLATLEKVAHGLNMTMTQIVLNWVVTQPGVAAAIVGASSTAQFDSSLAALGFELPAELRTELDEASSTPPAKPYSTFTPECQSWIVNVDGEVGDNPAGCQPPLRNWAR
jgi:diketogulonate reductase-like aldo/keto reductase